MKPTEAQMDFIHRIEEYCEPFEGETIEDASEYIDEHIAEFKAKQYNARRFGFTR